MYFKLNKQTENYFLGKPETGMGYQIIEASKSSSHYRKEKYIVLNSQIVINMNREQDKFIKEAISIGSDNIKLSAIEITLSDIKILSEREFLSTLVKAKM